MEPLDERDPRWAGEYQLLGRLGSGGMGHVFLGSSLTGRMVAVKLIRPELSCDPAFRRLFRREVAAARRVSGMFTAPVVDADPDGDPPWLATVFVPGPSLSAVVTACGALPEASVWPLAAGLVEALITIHRVGIVHRDLKPSNVLLSAEGPRVIDFGIARAMDATVMTRPGLIVGTPGFMSPEQAQGFEVGAASDVFSLGSLLVYGASGHAPFGEGNPPELLYRVVTADPDLAGVPPELSGLAGRCLAKDPDARPTPRQLLSVITGRSQVRISPEIRTAPWPPDVSRFIDDRQVQGGTAHVARSPEAEVVATPEPVRADVDEQVGLRDDGVVATPEPVRVGKQPQPSHPADLSAGVWGHKDARLDVLRPTRRGRFPKWVGDYGRVLLLEGILAGVVYLVSAGFGSQPQPALKPGPAPVSTPTAPPEPAPRTLPERRTSTPAARVSIPPPAQVPWSQTPAPTQRVRTPQGPTGTPTQTQTPTPSPPASASTTATPTTATSPPATLPVPSTSFPAQPP